MPPPPPPPPTGPTRFVAVLHGVLRTEADERAWTEARIRAAFFRALPAAGYPVVGQDVRITRVIRDLPSGAADAVLSARARAPGNQPLVTVAAQAIPALASDNWAGQAARLLIVGASLNPVVLAARAAHTIAGRRIGDQLVTVAALIEVAPGITYFQAKDALYAGLAREFPAPAWSSVVVGPYVPEVNGPLQFWTTPTERGGRPPAFVTRTRNAVMTLRDAIAFDEDNPVGPNRGRGDAVGRAASVMQMLEGVAATAAPDARAAAEVVREAGARVAEGLQQAGHTLEELRRRAGSALSDLLWSIVKGVLYVGAGVVVLGAGSTYLYGKATGQTTLGAAKDLGRKGLGAAKSAALLHPAGRAAAVAGKLSAPGARENPAARERWRFFYEVVDADVNGRIAYVEAEGASRVEAAKRANKAASRVANLTFADGLKPPPASEVDRVMHMAPVSDDDERHGQRAVRVNPAGERDWWTGDGPSAVVEDRPALDAGRRHRLSRAGSGWLLERGVGRGARGTRSAHRTLAGARAALDAASAADHERARRAARGNPSGGAAVVKGDERALAELDRLYREAPCVVPFPAAAEYPHKAGSDRGDPEHRAWTGYADALADAQERAAIRSEDGASDDEFDCFVREELARDPRFAGWDATARASAAGYRRRLAKRAPKLGAASPLREAMQRRASALAAGEDVTDANYTDGLAESTRKQWDRRRHGAAPRKGKR